jgi:hypothetical protein
MAVATLGGQSVSEWLVGNRPAVDPAPAPPVQARVRPVAPKRGRALLALTWIVGFGVGAWLALPALLEPGNFPPDGEGAVYWYLQHGVLRAVMTVMLMTACCVLIPQWLHRAALLIRHRQHIVRAPRVRCEEINDYLFASVSTS